MDIFWVCNGNVRVPFQAGSEPGHDHRYTRPGFVYTRMGWKIRSEPGKTGEKRSNSTFLPGG